MSLYLKRFVIRLKIHTGINNPDNKHKTLKANGRKTTENRQTEAKSHLQK